VDDFEYRMIKHAARDAVLDAHRPPSDSQEHARAGTMQQ
jgi:hypothetical protein